MPIIRVNGTQIEFILSVNLKIYLDEKLNFQKHISELLVAVKKRLNILKMLAGSKWGCSKWGGHLGTLLTILKITVAYNRGLRICLRSLKTTTTAALEVEAGSVGKEVLKPTKRICRWPGGWNRVS